MRCFLWVIVFVSIFFQDAASQIKSHNAPYYTWFDQVLGLENTNLMNGSYYISKYAGRIIGDKHPYFFSDKPLKGSVVYDDQHYSNVDIIYNLEIQTLIIKLNTGLGSSVMKLVHDKVNSFIINTSKFIKVDDFYDDGSRISGFHEEILQETFFSLLKRHLKIRKESNVIEQKLYYDYSSSYTYILFYNNSFKKIKSRSDMVNIFPELKNEIKTFYKSYKPLLKRDSDAFMQRLFLQIVKPSLSKK